MKAVEYTAFGHMRTLSQWGKVTGIPAKALYWRVKHGGRTMEEAIQMGEAVQGTRPKRFVTFRGEKIGLSRLARMTGIRYQVLRYRIEEMGLTAEEAVDRSGWDGVNPVKPKAVARVEPFANGCLYEPDCDNCPFPDCRM